MNQSVCDIFQVEILATRPQITFSVPITLKVPIYSCHQRVASNVKLSILIEQWAFYVFLNDVRSFLSIDMCVSHYITDLLELSAYLNTATSVSVLTRLYYPYGFP